MTVIRDTRASGGESTIEVLDLATAAAGSSCPTRRMGAMDEAAALFAASMVGPRVLANSESTLHSFYTNRVGTKVGQTPLGPAITGVAVQTVLEPAVTASTFPISARRQHASS